MLYNHIKKIIYSQTAKNSFLFTLFSFINSGFSFFLLLLLANYITPAEYGVLNLFTVSVTILSIFITLGSQGYVGVVYFSENNNAYRSIITIVFFISTFIFVWYIFVILFFPSFCQKLVGIEISLLIIAAVVCYFYVFQNILLDILRIKENVFGYGLVSVSNSALNFIMSILFVIVFAYGWIGRIYTIFILGFFYFLISIFYLSKNRQIDFHVPSKAVVWDCLKYSLPLLPHMTGVWIRQGSDRFIINMYHDQKAVGLFGFAATISSIIIMVGTAFNSVNSVQIYKLLSRGYYINKNKLDRVIFYTSVVFAFISFGLIIVTYIVLPFMFPKYVDSFVFVIPLVLSAFFQCIYLLYVNYLFYYKKTVVLMYITVTCSVSQLLLSLILTKYSVLFTGYINMFTNLLICSSVILYKSKICKQVSMNEIKSEIK